MSKKSFVLVLLALVMSLMSAVSAFAEVNEEKAEAINTAKASFADLYEEINPSVVYIAVSKAEEDGSASGNMEDFGFGDIFGPELEEFFKQFEEYYQNENDPEEPMLEDDKDKNIVYGSGTGFVWDNNGNIVTNNHVIEGADKITVTYSDGLVRDAVLVGADPDSDLAVIHVDDFEDVAPLTMGDSTSVKPGDLVAAIGNPLGQTGTMTQGIVSALHRSFTVDNGDENGNYSIPDMIQTDASINPGNSGGVLINLNGEVIGVVNSFSSYSYSSAGIGYAIPGNLAKRVVPALIADGKYQHPWIGMSGIALNPDINEALELEHDQRGAYVQTVLEGSPAGESGLVAGTEELELESGVKIYVGGDIITKIGERDVFTMDDVIAYLSSETSVGDTILLHVIHDNGEEEDLELTLKARPTAEERTAALAAEEETKDGDNDAAYLGVYVLDLNRQILNLMELPEDTKGVLVQGVETDSPAEDAGLLGCTESKFMDGEEVEFGGDIITAIDGTAIKNVEALKSALADYLPGDRITMTVIRDGEETEVRLYLGRASDQR